LSKLSREELIGRFIAAIRASQSATDAVDEAVAEYLGINRTDFRCIDILDQEGPMTAGRLAERARISPAATTTLLDRLEARGLARRTRDTEDRRRVLVEVTPELRRMAAQVYGTPEEAGRALDHYTEEQLEFLTAFAEGSVAFQQERLRRIDALKARDAEADPPVSGPRRRGSRA
jgi:DNA-binding MarR family transcriptional regulator